MEGQVVPDLIDVHFRKAVLVEFREIRCWYDHLVGLRKGLEIRPAGSCEAQEH